MIKITKLEISVMIDVCPNFPNIKHDIFRYDNFSFIFLISVINFSVLFS